MTKQVFFLSGFSFMNIYNSQDNRGSGRQSCPLYHFDMFHRHLDINWAITAESAVGLELVTWFLSWFLKGLSLLPNIPKGGAGAGGPGQALNF